jgi:hypothetical protein
MHAFGVGRRETQIQEQVCAGLADMPDLRVDLHHRFAFN